jgi:hypothetical protein
MKKIFKFALMGAMAAVGAVAMNSCGGDDKPDPQIVLPGEDDKIQTAYANDTEKEIAFTAKSPWTATVDAAPVRASNVAWIRLSVNDTETYAGTTGTVNLTIEMELNDTGMDRSATITLKSGTDETRITVTQKGVKQDNKPLDNKDLLVAHPWKHVKTTDEFSEGPTWYLYPDDINTEDYTLTFNANGTTTADGGDGLWDGTTYTVADKKLTITEHVDGEALDPTEYTITKLTGSELIFTARLKGMTFHETYGEDPYFYLVTMRFVKP